MSRRRVRGILRKELREYRRHPSILIAVAIFPIIFLIQPIVVVFLVPASSARALSDEHLILYMLAIPVLAPGMLAAYAVAGERQQGTLEPVLTTPIPREEFLVGKALAALVPSVAVSYAVYAVFVLSVLLFARSGVAGALLQPPDLLAQVVFTPLLAAWSTWVGIAVSTRSSDVRVAQQVTLLASVPFVVVTSLVAFDVIQVTRALVLGAAIALFAADVLGWRFVAPLFDRERLIIGTRG